MKSEKEIKDALWVIYQQDMNCPVEAHKTGTTCFDVGHAIRGTWRHALRWVIGEADAPWKK